MTVWYFTNQKGLAMVGRPGSIFSQHRGVAWEDKGWFFATGFQNQNDDICRDSANEFADIKAWIRENFGDNNPIKTPYVPGTFYRRIWRPSVNGNAPLGHIHLYAATESFVALSILVNKLEELFEFVTPSIDTQHVYGHKIREILLLASMEVES